jgi:hypothetical protein
VNVILDIIGGITRRNIECLAKDAARQIGLREATKPRSA